MVHFYQNRMLLRNNSIQENQEINKETSIHNKPKDVLFYFSVDVINTISYSNLESERIYNHQCVKAVKKIRAGS